MAIIPNTAVASKAILLAALNTVLNKNYTLEQINFTNMAPRLTDPNFNTGLDVTAIIGSGYTGFKPIRYNRLDIGLFFGGALVIDASALVATTIYELLPAINSQLNLAIREDELVDGPVNLSADTAFTILVSNTSELWMEGSMVSVALSTLPAGTFLDLGGGQLLALDLTTLLNISS